MCVCVWVCVCERERYVLVEGGGGARGVCRCVCALVGGAFLCECVRVTFAYIKLSVHEAALLKPQHSIPARRYANQQLG